MNPIYGSVGLLWSGSWQLCQSAVEAVLRGAPIVQAASEPAESPGPSMNRCDIRHVREKELHRVKNRSRFKRVARKPKSQLESAAAELALERVSDPCSSSPDGLARVTSHHDELNAESESAFSVETVEASLVDRAEPKPDSRADDSEPYPDPDLDLDLTLGFPMQDGHVELKFDVDEHDQNTCNVVELGLDLSS